MFQAPNSSYFCRMTEKEEFIIQLATSIHQNGIPAHRLENTMQIVCESLEQKADFSATPELLLISFSSKENASTHMKKCSGSELNFEKMTRLDQLIENVGQKKQTIAAAKGELESINQLPQRYGSLMNIFSIGLSTSSAACLFGGGWAEIIVAACIGFVIGILMELLAFFPNLGRLTVLFSSTFAIFFAKWSISWIGAYSIEIATITGLILLIPGFSLSLSVTELANGHAQSGTVRFSNALVTFVMIAVGIGLGNQLAAHISVTPIKAIFKEIPTWVSYVAIALVPAGFVVLFKAQIKHYHWMLLSCLTAYYSVKYFSSFNIGELSVFFAAFSLGLVSNSLSRLIKQPVTLMLVPGIILLVPGSIGFRSISALVNAETLNGIESAFSTLVSAAALTAGLLFSNMIVRLNKGF
jgi:uncharacterized membrane protein YjjP (DUF1212 family)